MIFVIQETLDSLSDLYVSLSEEDLWAGLWMERCRFPETTVAIAYETQGLFELAQESYEKVLSNTILTLFRFQLPYSGNISWEKNFAKASTRVLHENSAGFYFRQCGKGYHVHCAIINTQEKI